MKLVQNIAKPLQSDWWIEIISEVPYCTYYFGPFSSSEEADLAQSGYIEDLVQEGAEGVSYQINQCNPLDLTICEDENTLNSAPK